MVASVTTDAKSSWFSGHFPGDPILPGIAQLKMVADLIASSGSGDRRLAGLGRVKFRRIVRPGDPLDIEVTRGDRKGRYSFRITSGGEDVCSGLMYFTSIEKEQRTAHS